MTDQLQTAPAVPAHDPGTYRRLPERTRPVDPEVVERLLAAEWARFTSWSGESGAHNERASKSLPPAASARRRAASPIRASPAARRRSSRVPGSSPARR